jgi:uncharacterized protein YggE
MMSQRLAIVIAFSALLVGQYPISSVQAQQRLIKVEGSGIHEVMPDSILFSFNISGSGSTAIKALADFRVKRQRIEDTLNPMDFPRTTLAFSGKQLNAGNSSQMQRIQMQMMMFQGQVDQENVELISVNEDFQLRLELGADGVSDETLANISRIVDTAMSGKATPAMNSSEPFYDHGGSGSAMVRAVLADPASARKEAVSRAFEDARAKAAELASLAGGKLGPVHSMSRMDSEIGAISPWADSSPVGSAIDVLGQKLRVSAAISVEFELVSDN